MFTAVKALLLFQLFGFWIWLLTGS